MIARAERNNADGFIYDGDTGRLLRGTYNRTCRSPANLTKPLYLKKATYDRMLYGYAGCSMSYGKSYTEVPLDFMIGESEKNGGHGFIYTNTGRFSFGRLLAKPYNRACRSSPRLAQHALYLKNPTFPYTEVSYSAFGCQGTAFGSRQNGVSLAFMVAEAEKSNSDGFIYYHFLKRGNIFTKPYDRTCQGTTYDASSLYLK